MMSGKPKKIISLNYHEITQDPRVLKEARALRQAGYDVTVFCDWPEGLPQHDEIDGVKVQRFRCYSYEGVTRDVLDDLSFLDHARSELSERFLPHAQLCEGLKAARPLLEKKLGPRVIERAEARSYKKTKGFQYLRGALAYHFMTLRLALLRIPVSRRHMDKAGAKTTQTAHAALRRYRKSSRTLYQADSVVYYANFPELTSEDGIDAVHAHDIYCLPTGVMLAQKLGVPLVYDAHEYEPARASKMAGDALNLPEQIEKDCFPFVARMIAVSDGIGDLYAQRFQGPSPSIIMNAPEIDADSVRNGAKLRPGVKSLREQMSLSDDVPLIVYTGFILGKQRGVDKLLEALALLPSVHFVSLGPRQTGSDKWLMKLARKFGVEKRVTLLPAVDARDVPSVISTATLSVAPIQDASLSYRHCMPNKLFEAAFAGIPICVSDLPDMKHFVEDLGIGRVMDQTDPQAIATVLQQVFDSRDEYLLTPEAEQKLIDVYSWQTQAEKLVGLYKAVLGGPSRQS